MALQTLKGHTNEVSCLTISPDGRILASGSKDGSIRLWTLWKVRLKQLISEQTCLESLKWVEDTLKDEKLTDAERKWLEFLRTVMRWQMRVDGKVEM